MMNAAKQNGYSVGEFAVSGCNPSSIPMEIKCEPHLRALEALKANPPDILIVAGYWKNIDYPNFATTLHDLHDVHSRVIVIGPVPIWNATVPRLLFLSAIRSGHLAIPQRIAADRNKIIDPIDKKMREMTEAEGFTYISALSVLCNSSGCEVTDEHGHPFQWDAEHLTDIGSLNFVSQIVSRLGMAQQITQEQ